MEHERARVILGFNALLSLPEKPTEIMPFIPDLFKSLLRLVKKNAEERIEEEYPSKKPKFPTYNDDDDDADI
jgi:hypothetical protein